MTARHHLYFWSFVCAAFLGFVFVFKEVLLPFVLGMAVAYLLNPVVNRLGKLGLNRGLAALLILFLFVLAVSGFFIALVPVLYKELLEFSKELPSYVEQAITVFDPVSKQVQALIGFENGNDIKALAREHIGTGVNVARTVLSNLVAGGQTVLGLLSLIIFTPVVAYFTMKEWPNITGWVEGLMPRDQKKTMKDLLVQIDQKLSGFVRGQISVAFMLGIAYAVALSFAGLKYGFLIGMGAGILSIIPMVGSAIGLVVSVLVAWFQSGDVVFVGIVGAIFLIGQFIEGNLLTPKLVGDSVGLHPLWVFFALLAGGSLFGILGMLLAVPVAAVAGVLIAFGIEQYKKTPYFRGRHGKQKKPKKKKVAKQA